jgi:hypothetical protein
MRVRLRQRKKMGPGDAAMAKPRANPLSSRLATGTSHIGELYFVVVSPLPGGARWAQPDLPAQRGGEA